MEDLNKLNYILNNSDDRLIKIDGNYNICLTYKEIKSKEFLIKLGGTNKCFDFSNCEINFDIFIEKDEEFETKLIDINADSQNIEIKSLFLRANLNGSCRKHTLIGIHNSSKDTKLIGCDLSLVSKCGGDLIGVYCNGQIKTHLESKADNFVMNDNRIKVECETKGEVVNSVIALVNNYANVVNIENNYFLAKNKGNYSSNRSIGIHNNGRYCRFNNNNIKACSMQPLDTKDDEGYSYGFINDGMLSIIANNNIIGEQGAFCVGLKNNADSCVICGNKILSSHCIGGKVLINSGSKTTINGNLITTSAKNFRCIEINSNDNIINSNTILTSMSDELNLTGVNIIVEGNENCPARGNNITANNIQNVKDIGILINNAEDTIVVNNVISSLKDTALDVKIENALNTVLEDNNIKNLNKATLFEMTLTDNYFSCDILGLEEAFTAILRIAEKNKLTRNIFIKNKDKKEDRRIVRLSSNRFISNKINSDEVFSKVSYLIYEATKQGKSKKEAIEILLKNFNKELIV